MENAFSEKDSRPLRVSEENGEENVKKTGQVRYSRLSNPSRFLAVDSDDDDAHVAAVGRVVSELSSGSIFSSLGEVSDFFEKGSLGYSAASKAGLYEGLELRTFGWQVTPLDVERVESSFFENEELFPTGSVEFDCALLMRGIEHEWHGRESLVSARSTACCGASQAR